MKKKGFTIVEGLISILIVSFIIIGAVYISDGYLRQTYQRDESIKRLTKNINIIEDIKGNVKTLDDLYNMSKSYNFKIIAIGLGEVELTKEADGNITLNENLNESYGFSDMLKPNKNLFRIEVGDKEKLITIIRLEGS